VDAEPAPAPRGLATRARSLAATKVFRDTGWSMVAEIAGMISQFGTLVLIAREFGAELYGVFAGTVAFMHVISPVTTVGMGYVVMQRVAGERHDPDTEAGRAFATVVLGGIAGMVVVLATSRLLLPQVPIRVLLALSLGELIFTQITFTGRFVAQSMDRPATGAQVTATVWMLRLLAAVVFILVVPRTTLAGWAYFHVSSSIVGAVLTLIVLGRVLPLRPRVGMARGIDVRQGLGYSLTIGATYLKNDADKTLLLTFEKDTAAGIYNLAYRVIVPLYVPVRAIADSTFARFFRDGSRSARDALRLARRTTMIGAAFTFVGGLVLVACAPILPHLLGDDYRDAVTATRWLAFVPFLVTFQMYSFNALLGLGRRRACVAVTIASSALNIALNLALIPRYTWRGSTVATIVSETLSAIALWTMLVRAAARHGDAVISAT
jgi:O-antigen/teichoic acid export membrane protein